MKVLQRYCFYLKYLRVILLIFLIQFSETVFCQRDQILDLNNSMQTLTIENGLSYNSVACITQDLDGFIWVGTDCGLQKYNGYEFEKFYFEIDQKSSITNNSIKDVSVDRKGKIWISTWGGGVNIFEKEKSIFTHFNNFSEKLIKDSVFLHHIRFVRCYNEDVYWIATLNGLVFYDAKASIFEIYLNQPDNPCSISDNRIEQMIETKKGIYLFVGFDGKLNVFNKNEKTFKRYSIPNPQNSKDFIGILSINELTNGEMLVGTQSGLYIFNLDSGCFFPAIISDDNNRVLKNKPILNIFEKSKDVYWLSTPTNGIIELQLRITPNGKPSFQVLRVMLERIVVNTFFKDTEGNVWIGTADNGLKVIYNKPNPIKYLNYETSTVYALTKDKNENLWIGSYTGLHKYNLKTKTSKLFDISNGLLSNYIRALYVDNNKRLLIGTESGLNVLDFSTDVITTWRDENNILNTPIVTINKDTQGNLWMGSDQKGLVRIDKNTGEVKNFFASSSYYPIGASNATSICFDSKQRLWVGIFGGGINLFDTKTNRFVKRFINDPSNNKSLNDNNVLDIYQDSKGGIWVGTFDGGLNFFNQEKGEFKPYLKKDGMPSNKISSILEDNSNNLWISTYNGLAKMNLETRKILALNKADGLISNVFKHRSKFKDENNAIYFGSSDLNFNVTILNHMPENTNDQEPRLLFTDFKINYLKPDFNDKESPLQKHISKTDSVILKHDQTDITIEYVAINFIAPQKTTYIFKLEGLDKDWTNATNQRSVHYPFLPVGKYRFLVKASTVEGTWSSKPIALYLEVLPPFWKSNTAYIIYVLLILLINILLFLFVKWILKRQHDIKLLQMDKEKNQQLTNFKLQFFTNISHELRTHLSLILFPINKLLKKHLNSNDDMLDLNSIDINVKRLVKLTDEIIDFRKIEQGQVILTLQKGNIVEFISHIKNMFELISAHNSITFKFLPEKESIIWCFDAENLTKILFNLLSNAFKYTPDGGEIQLYVKVVNGGQNNRSEILVIGIEDNGIGISEESLPYIFDRFFNPGKELLSDMNYQSSGIGLALVKQLVELHNGKIFVESTTGKGSHFYFELPMPEGEFEWAENTEYALNSNTLMYEKWEEILHLERGNVQDEFALPPEPKAEDTATILVVDDNKEICLAIRNILVSKYRVFMAKNGFEALELLNKENIDIVLSDIMMPQMDGITLSNRMNNSIEYSHIPIILLTAKAGNDNEIAGLKTGASAYITKPFSEEMVLITIENILNKIKRLQAFFNSKESEESIEAALNEHDIKLMSRIKEKIFQNMGNSEFSIDDLGKEMGLSRMHLYRKVKILTGVSPSDYLKKFRLEKGQELIKEGKLSLSEIADKIGFSTAGNFSTAFKKYFGQTPTEYKTKFFI